MRAQASATTQHRRHTTDIHLLTALFHPHKWSAYFEPMAHIPAALLGDMLHQGFDPRDQAQQGRFTRRLTAGPVLRDDRVWQSATTPGSLFAALDQCPQALLYHCSHGAVQGVQR